MSFYENKNKKSKKILVGSALTVGSLLLGGLGATAYAQGPTVESVDRISSLRSPYQGKDRVVITWDKVPGAEGYVVDFAESYDGNLFDRDTNYVEGKNWLTQRVSSGAEVEYTVYPYAEDGSFEQYEPAILTVKAKGISAVRDLTATNWDENSVSLQWSGSDGAVKYLVQKKNDDGTFKKVRTVYSQKDTVSYTVKNLEPETEHTFRLIAVDASGDRSAPELLNTETLQAPEVVETPISGLRSTYQSKDRIVVTWDKKPEADAYKVVWFGAGTDFEDFDIVEKNWFTVKTRSGQKNEITVIPWYGQNSKYSERASIEVTSKGLPAVSKLTASKIDENSVQLRWLKAKEDPKYIVSAREHDGGYAKIATVTDNTDTVEFLVELDRLKFQAGDFDIENPEFKVVVVDANGDQSTHMVVTPRQQARAQ